MRIKEARIDNFRAVGESRLELGDMTAMIGSNGAGKTAMLLAIARFFSKAQTINPANFGSKERPIAVTLVAEAESGRAMEVTREWHLDKEQGKGVSPGYARGDIATADLSELLRARAVYVPAAHEPTGGGRDTVLQSLVDAMAGHEAACGAGPPRKVAMTGLGLVEDAINKRLGTRDGIGYAPNIGVRLRFGDPEGLTGLRMTITDRETGRELDYAHVGHGARRALHMAALETDADILGRDDGRPDAGMATLYIIDEPELHQHPLRQDLIFSALRRLSEESSTQVIYATHSPHLVALEAQMRILRIRRDGARIGIQSTTGAGEASISGGVVRPIEEAIFANGAVLVEGHRDEVITRAILQSTPHIGGSLMSTLASREIMVVDCRSKYNIEHYYRFLDRLGTRCVVVWDGDMGMSDAPALAQAKITNKRLLEILGEPEKEEAILRAGAGDCIVGENWACFGHNLPSYFASYSELEPRELERRARDDESIDLLLDKGLFQNEFCRVVLPDICRALIG